MLELLIYSVLIAVTAHVFNHVLMGENMIFGWYNNLLERWSFDIETGEQRWFYYLAKPLGYCDVCFGGQLALLFYIFYGDYNLIIHIFFISLTILFIKWLKKRN